MQRKVLRKAALEVRFCSDLESDYEECPQDCRASGAHMSTELGHDVTAGCPQQKNLHACGVGVGWERS